MATKTEYLKTLITTAGGDASSLPDNLESTHYKALIEALANGTGSGGGEWVLLCDETATIDNAVAEIRLCNNIDPNCEKYIIYAYLSKATEGGKSGYTFIVLNGETIGWYLYNISTETLGQQLYMFIDKTKPVQEVTYFNLNTSSPSIDFMTKSNATPKIAGYYTAKTSIDGCGFTVTNTWAGKCSMRIYGYKR